MNNWILAALAYLAAAIWFAWMIYSAPEAIQDQRGFHLTAPGHRWQDLLVRKHFPERVWFG